MVSHTKDTEILLFAFNPKTERGNVCNFKMFVAPFRKSGCGYQQISQTLPTYSIRIERMFSVVLKPGSNAEIVRPSGNEKKVSPLRSHEKRQQVINDA